MSEKSELNLNTLRQEICKIIEPEYKSIKDFYPFYLSQHKNNLNRLLHVIGTSLGVIVIFINLIFGKFSNIIFGPLFGYGFAWVGHFFFEKNKPATFKYPLFSFLCDYIMIYDILSGQISKKLKNNSIENIKYIDSELF
jgi:hypothetical protein